MRTIYLVLKEDIIFYPPVLSIMNVLLDLGYNVVHIGDYSDDAGKRALTGRGVLFLPTIRYDIHVSILRKVYQQLKFKYQVLSYLKQCRLSSEDYVWIFKSENLCLLDKVPSCYNTIVHQFEFDNPRLNWKYRLLNPFFKMRKVLGKAEKVVSCEYNRAQITKGIYNLDRLPFVLPNKPYIPDDDIAGGLPGDIAQIVDKVRNVVVGKKVILYQGVFGEDRNLNEFCQAMEYMPDDYVMLMMGSDSAMYRNLKSEYESDKVVFIPFIRPPYHLVITEMAHIGILTYVPSSTSFADVINPIYCAPNKIFEYAKFGIPMIANNIPGLYYIFLEYKCGKCIDYPISPVNIKDSIMDMIDNYGNYSDNAREYYNSVDLKNLIGKLVES